MADWKTVRYDSSYEEKLDEEIIPLCDALNKAGFVTVQSCWGHGCAPPRVWFNCDDDEQVEKLARFAMKAEGSNCPCCYVFSKIIRPEGHEWKLEIRLNNVFADTPQPEVESEARTALSSMAQMIEAFLLTYVPTHQGII